MAMRDRSAKKSLREPLLPLIVMPIVTPHGRLEYVVSLPPAADAQPASGSTDTPTGIINSRQVRSTIQYIINHGPVFTPVGARHY
jgi:hypothetical protein